MNCKLCLLACVLYNALLFIPLYIISYLYAIIYKRATGNKLSRSHITYKLTNRYGERMQEAVYELD